jgi:signal transduction histidine kinase
MSAGKILIVDDDIMIRTLMRATLENDGFTVIEAADGEEACRLFGEEKPDALISDVVMPGMDGFDMCRNLRAKAESEHVPILMATGLDDMNSITTAYEAGATDFTAKPINWAVLNHRVRYILRAARAFQKLRESQQHLLSAKDAAEAASRAKTEFLANMSHELRTPLNAIIGFSGVMVEQIFGPMPQKYDEYAQDINASGTHLLTLINDILDLTKAESNRMTLSESEVDLAAAAVDSVMMVQKMAGDADIALTVDLEPGLPLLLADAAKLRQILINLLSNAVKFTPDGGSVTLSVKRDRDGVGIRVADTGIGIPADKIAVAMSPFGQVDSGLSRRYDGTGLGLPLTKKLAELHGGTLDLQSVVSKGTLVTIWLPPERVLLAPLSHATVA